MSSSNHIPNEPISGRNLSMGRDKEDALYVQHE
jgi:hypothetical protein